MGTVSIPIEVFYSYAEEDAPLQEQLERRLSVLRRKGVITTWHKRQIVPGREWQGEIDRHLNSASLILLLISSDFLASDYCYGIEMQRALARHTTNEAVVLPILLRPCDWKAAPFAALAALPSGDRPITQWQDRDACLDRRGQGHTPPA